MMKSQTSLALRLSLASLWPYCTWFLANQLIYHYSDQNGNKWDHLLGWSLCLASILFSLWLIFGHQSNILVLDYVRYISFFCFFIIFAMHIQSCFIERLSIDGDSMNPSLSEGETIWIEKISSGIGLPPLFFPFVDSSNALLPRKVFADGLSSLQRGDIVVFRYPSRGKGKKEVLYIKRIIGLAKERYKILGGRVYINNKLLTEMYLPQNTYTHIRPEVEPLAMSDLPKDITRGQLNPIVAYTAQFGLPSYGMIPEGTVLVLGDKRKTSSDSRSFGFVPISYIVGKALSNE